MKATGIIRRIDELGRIVIPMEIRKRWGLKDGTPMELYTEDNKIVLRKYLQEPDVKDSLDVLNFVFQDTRHIFEKDTADKIEKHIDALMEILKERESEE